MELPADKSDAGTVGFLSSLLGDGCECHGYSIEIVGHSLGGSVASLLGIRVYLFIFKLQNLFQLFKSSNVADLPYSVRNLIEPFWVNPLHYYRYMPIGK